MSRPAACLFDLDGLLLDTEPLHGQAWSEAARRFGAELSAEQLLELRGRRRQDNCLRVIEWIQEAGGTAPDSVGLLAVQQPIARRLLATAQPIPGAPELVQRCHRLGIPMALATSSTAEAVARKCAPHPWLDLIRERVHGDDPDLEAGKPSPDIFKLAASRLGVSPQECWAFEDSPAGAQAALEAGCLVHVLVPAGLGEAERRRLYPGIDNYLDSLWSIEIPTDPEKDPESGPLAR